MAKLTTKFIENAKPAAVRREIPDAGCRGLYLIIQPTGRKVWAVRYRFEGTTRKLTLDAGLTLAAARKATTDALHELEQGRDPAALKFEARATAAKTAADLAADTVEKLFADFIAKYAQKETRPSTWRQYQHILNDLVLPAWRGRTVHDIKRKHVIALLDDLKQERPVMANRVLATLSKFFNWLMARDLIVASPCSGVAYPSKETARDRILSDDEIKSLWSALDAIGGPIAACVKVMLLTGQRRSEVSGMRRSELGGDVWTLPPGRTKNNHKHSVPLSHQVLALIEGVPPLGDFIFSSDGNRAVGNFSSFKAAVDARMKPDQPFVWHDLRRTVASGMARLSVQLPVIEKALNHTGGSFRGIVQVYQHHSFLTEMRDALQRWANFIDDLVHGRPADDKVVPISARR
jgi:integrase